MNDNEFPIPGRLMADVGLGNQARSVLSRVREICNWGRPTFPGSQPVSLSRTNIGLLGSKPYVACEKTDGVRYLLFAASRLVFLIDRKETITVLNLTLPLPGLTEDASGRLITHQSTLLDGELVRDVLHDGTARVAFLVYDSIAINRDTSIAKQNLLNRLCQALTTVVRPREELERMHPEIVEREKETNNYLPIYLKDFYEIWDIQNIRSFQKRLPHLSDGIIFTPVVLPYIAGTCRQLLKWKPPELNTLDFASQLIYAPLATGETIPVAAKLLIGSHGFRRDSRYWIVAGKGKWDEMVQRHMTNSDCDNAIWECYFDPKAYTVIPSEVENPEEVDLKMSKWTAFWKRFDTGTAGDNDRERNLMKARTAADLEAMDSGESIVASGDAVEYGYSPMAFPYGKDTGKIYYDFNECTVVEGGWVLERIRTDKLTPNDERVMQRVKESIDSGISFVVLFDQIMQYRAAGCQPVYKSCLLPEYYATNGTRLQHVNGEELNEKTAEKAEEKTEKKIEKKTEVKAPREKAPREKAPREEPQKKVTKGGARASGTKTQKEADDDDESSSGTERKFISSDSSEEDA